MGNHQASGYPTEGIIYDPCTATDLESAETGQRKKTKSESDDSERAALFGLKELREYRNALENIRTSTRYSDPESRELRIAYEALCQVLREQYQIKQAILIWSKNVGDLYASEAAIDLGKGTRQLMEQMILNVKNLNVSYRADFIFRLRRTRDLSEPERIFFEISEAWRCPMITYAFELERRTKPMTPIGGAFRPKSSSGGSVSTTTTTTNG